MSTGDFNGSFSPNLVGGVSNVLLGYTGMVMSVPANLPFTLPVILSSTSQPLTVGAISLILNVPSNLVNVQSVTIAGSAVLPTFKSAGSLLTIGWNSTTPVTVQPGSPLVNITMVPKNSFTSLQTLALTLTVNPLNEIADAAFVPIANPGLLVDHVTTQAPATASSLKVSVSPNPATASIVLTYLLPNAGTVNMSIVTGKGVLVKTLVNNVNMGPGTFNLADDVSTLLPGTYNVNLSQTVAGKTKTTSSKFVKQ
jgi:hypothetical protein